jgi:hypothetical protein
LIAIGLYRGWFTVSGPNRDAHSDKVKVGVSVDVKKMKSDLKNAKQDITSGVEQLEHRGKDGTTPTKPGGS